MVDFDKFNPENYTNTNTNTNLQIQIQILICSGKIQFDKYYHPKKVSHCKRDNDQLIYIVMTAWTLDEDDKMIMSTNSFW